MENSRTNFSVCRTRISSCISASASGDASLKMRNMTRWYHMGMLEGPPRQPKGLDPLDEQTLAVIGSRNDLWEAMKDRSRPATDRREKFLQTTAAHMRTMRE